MRRQFVAKVLIDRSGVFWSSRIIMVAYLAIGAGLTVQSSRFERTPSYGNLLILAPAAVWGVLYILSAAALTLWVGMQPRELKWGVIAHLLPLGLTGFWLMAFVVRYFTDTSTTIVNVVSWSVFLLVLAHSLALVFDREPG